MPPLKKYTSSAEFYDAIYTAQKDYGAEAQEVNELLNKYTERPINSLLDVATGTGLHLEYFEKLYLHVAGLDLSDKQLAIARQRMPKVVLHQADMLNFRLYSTFDAITCLFSAIGYMHTPAELEQAFVMMGDHLYTGGVLLVEPWILPSDWQDGLRHVQLVETPDFLCVRMNRSYSEGNMSILRMHYLVMRESDVEPEHFIEQHRLCMHTVEEYLAAMNAAGFDAEYVANDRRGYVVGVKRS